MVVYSAPNGWCDWFTHIFQDLFTGTGLVVTLPQYQRMNLEECFTIITRSSISWYTLGKKGCYTPIEDNKTNVDRTFVFPLGWNWHDMDPWLFPNEIRHYLGQTFNARSSLQGLPERQHLGKTMHCWGWSDRIVSWVLGPWRRGWEICTEWGLVTQRLTTDSCPVVTGHIDPQRSPCWLPTTVVSAWSGRRGGGTWQWPTGSMSSSVMSRDSNFTR